jgi:hypothetical protein
MKNEKACCILRDRVASPVVRDDFTALEANLHLVLVDRTGGQRERRSS